MGKGRLEAFSDGVFAIIITIMVLELKVPEGAALADLQPLIPVFISYVLSFVFVGIYWNNHHHLLQVCKQVSGRALWANTHLLFWLSLVPFVTNWLGEHPSEQWPVALYGAVLWLSGLAYFLLTRALVAQHDASTVLVQALQRDGKGLISLVVYTLAIPLAFVNTWLSYGLYVLVAVLWFVPDRRIEGRLS
jgi:uncharacterized membrane protein